MLKDLLKPQDILYIYDLHNFTYNISDVFNTLKKIFDKEVSIITIQSNQMNTFKYRNTHKILSAYSELLPILNSVINTYIETPKEKKKKNRIDLNIIKEDLKEYRAIGLNYSACTKLLNSKNIKITDKTVKKYCQLLQIK
jgi:DNA invertase Pin-like site-specific DNA recombinase